ncbi:SPOR domain-containing protein [Haliea sp. E1-2-M8]|uniref:SPOR domain-containing protein n=1 Tax=Haliea sp. E1-2-M8 TaxID=3064706 RepID=UPI00271FB016|nr:SPOR domain-containing protein [Haliea sp. E1-2-M8]MDO8862891.1 SPOR domain-containing protein [Haliea sp. E1-2-M8]
MNDILKQRLVGALILIALGVIFWPIIFVDPDQDVGMEDLRIPPRPQVDTTPIAPPDPAGLRGSPELEYDEEEFADDGGLEEDSRGFAEPVPADGAEAQPEPEQTPVVAAPPAPGETRTEAPEQPVIDAQGVPVAWMLQVASVSSAENAEELRQRLQALGEKAWVAPVTIDGRAMYRVNVGPKFERARLEALQSDIDAEFGVNSLVKRYLP